MRTEFLSLNERRELLESFKEKTITEVICSLPTWPLFAETELSNPEIEFYPLKFYLNRFEVELWQPGKQEWYQGLPQIEVRDIPDRPLPPIKAVQGEKLDPRVFDVNLGPGWALGFTSKVRLTLKGDQLPTKLQIPMMDFDFDPNAIDEYGVLWTIKKNLCEIAEISGLILKSSGKEGHFHFLGDRLFSNEQFLTFLGVCLLVEYEGKPLADPRYIGHSLTRGLRSLKELRDYDEWWSPHSIYCKLEDDYWPYPDISTTLRINPGKPGYGEPKVIDFVGW